MKHKSRRATLEKKHGTPLDMPACEAEYMLAYLFEVGPMLHSEMGASSLTHSELRAWMDNTGIELSAWEARILCRLSMEYLNECNRSTAPSAVPPWSDAPYAKVDPVMRIKRLQQHIERLAK